MFRFLIRSGVVALFVLCLSAPAQALPLGEDWSFEVSLSEIWKRLTAEVVSLWTGAPTTDTRGACDPNGGGCNP